jgi:hypothetical protein
MDQLQVAIKGGRVFRTEEQLQVEKKGALAKSPKGLQKGETVGTVMAKKDATIYLGITRQRIEDEAYDVFGRSGKSTNGNRHVPLITHADGRRITKTEAKKKFGFRALEVWTDPAMYECARMEKKLQEIFDAEPLGTRRLWRNAGHGDNFIKVVGTKSRPCMVYLTWSETAKGFIEDGTLIVGDPEKTKAHDDAHGLMWGK